MLKQFFNRFPSAVWVITVLNFLNSAAFAISLPFLALYLHQQRGVSMTLVGSILFVSGVFSAVAQMFAGALSDRFGRRPLLLGTVLASILLYGAMALMIGISAPVFAIAIVYAGARSVLMMMRPVKSAMVADLSSKERLAEAFGLVRIGQNVGWAAGPAVGGYLAATLSYAWLFGLGSIVVVIAFVLVLVLLRESSGTVSEGVDIRRTLSIVRDRRFAGFTLLSLLVFLVMGQMSSTLSIFTVDRAGFTTSQYGFLLTLNGLIVVVFQYPLTQFLSSRTKSATLALAGFLYGMGYLSMGWVGSYALAVAGMVIITAGEISFAPTSLAVVGELSPVAQRGRYMGFYGLAETLGFSFGPLIGGILLDTFPAQPVPLWGTISFLAMVAAIGFLRWGRLLKHG